MTDDVRRTGQSHIASRRNQTHLQKNGLDPSLFSCGYPQDRAHCGFNPIATATVIGEIAQQQSGKQMASIQFSQDHGPTRIRPRIVAILVATVLLTTTATFFGATRYFERQTIADAQSQLSLYLRSLNEALKQYQHLPYILAQNNLVRIQVERGDTQSLNAMLRDFANTANLEAIYVMALDGLVVASSNATEPQSFLGQNYGFRPYFQEAVNGKRSDYFAIGATSGRPGYFVAEPLKSVAGNTIGVVAIKLDVSELQASWERRGETVLATNQDGIVVLSANPAWLYLNIDGLGDDRRAAIVASRQFGDKTLAPLPWSDTGDGKVTVQGDKFVIVSDVADWRGWSVHYLTPAASIARSTYAVTGFMGTVIAVLIGFATFLRSQRIALALESSQRHRRELIAANTQLVSAQEELARTSKLAALGQLAASVTHELGQPISALKNHLAAAEIGNEITSPETALNLRRLADRMETITKQLRFFSRKKSDEMKPTDLRSVVQESLALVRHDFKANGVAIDYDPGTGPLNVHGHQIQLEQALVNLLQNALYAVQGADDPRVTIALSATPTTRMVKISDNGPGLDGKSLDDLQEPFFSTKSSGVGMGLGLSISAEIVRAHGGTMTAQNKTTGGAEFSISLPLTAEDPE